MNKVKIAAITCEQPLQKFGNDDPIFANLPEMSNRWWRFWGIERRGFFRPEQGENELVIAKAAVTRLLKSTDTDAGDVDLLLCAASCPILTESGNVLPNNVARLYPRLGRVLRQELGLNNALNFDVQMECASFLLNLKLASSFIQQGKAKNAVIVCCEYISNMLDFTSRSSTIFADGCVAVLLTESDDGSDLLASSQHSNAEHYEIATGKWRLPEIASPNDKVKLYFTLLEEGQSKMQEFVPQNVPLAVNRALDKALLTSEQIDYFIFHQPSPFLMHAWATGVGCPEDKYLQTMQQNGVMVSASMPFTLYTALSKELISENSTIVLAGAATGWGFASQVWRMGKVIIC